MTWQDEQKKVATGVTGADESVIWGVDWGKAGDIPCVSIIKRLPDGRIKVIAVEYAPYSYLQASDMIRKHDDETAKQRHEENK